MFRFSKRLPVSNTPLPSTYRIQPRPMIPIAVDMSELFSSRAANVRRWPSIEESSSENEREFPLSTKGTKVAGSLGVSSQKMTGTRTMMRPVIARLYVEKSV